MLLAFFNNIAQYQEVAKQPGEKLGIWFSEKIEKWGSEYILAVLERCVFVGPKPAFFSYS
jgi:hypothetical protein